MYYALWSQLSLSIVILQSQKNSKKIILMFLMIDLNVTVEWFHLQSFQNAREVHFSVGELRKLLGLNQNCHFQQNICSKSFEIECYLFSFYRLKHLKGLVHFSIWLKKRFWIFYCHVDSYTTLPDGSLGRESCKTLPRCDWKFCLSTQSCQWREEIKTVCNLHGFSHHQTTQRGAKEC